MKRFGIIMLLLFGSISAFGHECVCPELTTLQVAAGYLSLMGFIKVLSIGAIGIGIGFIFSGFFKKAIGFMKEIIEGLLWLLAIIGLIGAYFIPIEYDWVRQYVVVISAILFPVAIITTSILRDLEQNEKKFARVLTVVWGISAVFYLDNIVGFLSVIALFATLGFSVGVGRFSYSFGFDEEDSLGRVIVVGSFLIISYIIYKITGINLEYLNVFESGVLWIGALASGIGLLITSSRWYDEGRLYIIMNLLTFVFFVVGAAIGLAFGINALTTMSLALFLFYLAGKIIEVDSDSMVGIGFKLIFVGGLFGTAWYYLSTHQDLAMKYLSITF